MNITVILGTAREGRKSDKVSNFVVEELKKNAEIDITLVDVKDYPMDATIA